MKIHSRVWFFSFHNVIQYFSISNFKTKYLHTRRTIKERSPYLQPTWLSQKISLLHISKINWTRCKRKIFKVCPECDDVRVERRLAKYGKVHLFHQLVYRFMVASHGLYLEIYDPIIHILYWHFLLDQINSADKVKL